MVDTVKLNTTVSMINEENFDQEWPT